MNEDSRKFDQQNETLSQKNGQNNNNKNVHFNPTNNLNGDKDKEPNPWKNQDRNTRMKICKQYIKDVYKNKIRGRTVTLTTKSLQKVYETCKQNKACLVAEVKRIALYFILKCVDRLKVTRVLNGSSYA